MLHSLLLVCCLFSTFFSTLSIFVYIVSRIFSFPEWEKYISSIFPNWQWFILVIKSKDIEENKKGSSYMEVGYKEDTEKDKKKKMCVRTAGREEEIDRN